MPKKFRVYRALWDSTTVHRYVGAVLARAVLVDNAWEALFTDTTLPHDQDGHIGRGYLYSHLYRSEQERGGAYNAKSLFNLLYIDIHILLPFCHKDNHLLTLLAIASGV